MGKRSTEEYLTKHGVILPSDIVKDKVLEAMEEHA